MEGFPGASVFLYSSSTPFTDVCSVHINWVKAETSLQIVKIWGWTSKRNILRFLPSDYATIFRSYNCFTRETEREKNENDFEGKRINFFVHRHFFVYLFRGFCWVKKRRETGAYARFAGAYQRLLSLNHLTLNMPDKMPLCYADYDSCPRPMAWARVMTAFLWLIYNNNIWCYT